MSARRPFPWSWPSAGPGSRRWALVAALVLTTIAWGSADITMRIDLPGPRSVPVHLLGILLLAAATASATLIAACERGSGGHGIGQATLGLVLVAVAVVWPLLPQHRFAGPVVADLSRSHGIHAGDPLLVVPLGAGLWLLGRSIRTLAPASRRVLAIGARRG